VLSTLFTSPTDFPGRYVGWDSTAAALSPCDPLNTYASGVVEVALPASNGISRAARATAATATARAFRRAAPLTLSLLALLNPRDVEGDKY